VVLILATVAFAAGFLINSGPPDYYSFIRELNEGPAADTSDPVPG
jgi:hypothetical protein